MPRKAVTRESVTDKRMGKLTRNCACCDGAGSVVDKGPLRAMEHEHERLCGCVHSGDLKRRSHVTMDSVMIPFVVVCMLEVVFARSHQPRVKGSHETFCMPVCF